MRIVGVDPGRTTGLALVEAERVRETEQHRSLLGLYEWLRDHRPIDLIVMERFYISHRTKDAHHPLHAIGVVLLFAERWHVEVVQQSPAVLRGRAAVTEGWSSPHIRSALSHVRYYLRRQGMDLYDI